MKKNLVFIILVLFIFVVNRMSYAQEKIEGPWLWMIAPAEEPGRGGSQATDFDSLQVASGGEVTEEIVAKRGAMPGQKIGDYAWTWGTITPTGWDNIQETVNRIGLSQDSDLNYISSYALLIFNAEEERNVTMRVGSDDSVKIWLNGEVVHKNPVDRGAEDFQDEFQADIKDGTNLLLVKVCEHGGEWSMFVGIDANYEIVDAVSVVAPVYIQLSMHRPATIGGEIPFELESYFSTGVRDFNFKLSFNADILRVKDINYGTFSNNGQEVTTTCGTPNIDNSLGEVSAISCQVSQNNTLNDQGILATVNFEAISAGQATIQVVDPEFKDADGKSIEVLHRDRDITVYGPHGNISGVVQDGSGKPVKGADVQAFSGGQPVGGGTKTDAKGYYLIENITKAGEVEVVASMPGILPIPTVKVDVQIGSQTEDVDFTIIQLTSFHSVTDYRGFIRNWLMLGAIDWENSGTFLMADQLNPQTQPNDNLFGVSETKLKEIDPKDGDFGTGLAKRLRWALYVDPSRDDWQRNHHRISPSELYPHQEQAVVYAFTHVKAPTDMKVNMELEHYGIFVWLNGEFVHTNSDHRCCWEPSNTSEWRPDVVKGVTLKKGWNSILIKTSRNEFSCRFASQSSLFAAVEPLTNLPVAPQLGATTTSIDQPQPVALTRGTFNLKLEKGLNMISLPVKPDQPMTSKTLAKEIGATVVIRLDPTNQKFVPFVPELFEGSNFTIEGDMGLIVNVKTSQTSTFTGTVWDNTAAAPIVPVGHQSVWAFGLVFDNLPTDSTLTVRNLRSGQTLQSLTGTAAIAFVDQSQQPVVYPEDWLEIQTENTRWRYRVTGQDLQQAFAVVSL
ncbi:MAG: carboxypeptidase regulatory-like domain-containing protein, partial [Candidatus Poribacteria bacterium]|nr:carboxypeptidase regulatory-like domain-containing protein [Candidatus Poribacteria bacterium]